MDRNPYREEEKKHTQRTKKLTHAALRHTYTCVQIEFWLNEICACHVIIFNDSLNEATSLCSSGLRSTFSILTGAYKTVVCRVLCNRLVIMRVPRPHSIYECTIYEVDESKSPVRYT